MFLFTVNLKSFSTPNISSSPPNCFNFLSAAASFFFVESNDERFFFHLCFFLHSRLWTFQCSTWCSFEQYFATLQRAHLLNFSCIFKPMSSSSQRGSEQRENLTHFDHALYQSYLLRQRAKAWSAPGQQYFHVCSVREADTYVWDHVSSAFFFPRLVRDACRRWVSIIKTQKVDFWTKYDNRAMSKQDTKSLQGKKPTKANGWGTKKNDLFVFLRPERLLKRHWSLRWTFGCSASMVGFLWGDYRSSASVVPGVWTNHHWPAYQYFHVLSVVTVPNEWHEEFANSCRCEAHSVSLQAGALVICTGQQISRFACLRMELVWGSAWSASCCILSNHLH